MCVCVDKGKSATVGEKPGSSFSSWKHNSNLEYKSPWCRLLTQSQQVVYLFLDSQTRLMCFMLQLGNPKIN